jgi:hypothetical protein
MDESIFGEISNFSLLPAAKEEVALYFFGDMSRIYQLKQWIKVLLKLQEEKPVCIIVTNKDVLSYLSQYTRFSLFYAKTQNDLLSFYENSNFKVILYVNNGKKNFYSLAYPKALHIHLNHGESEKSSMHSNQSKSYDYIFVVGDAAIKRYERHMINIDITKYIKIGRPQLDHIQKFNKPQKKVVLYAPTDESTHISMRYTSLTKHGTSIVNTILKNKSYHLIYRPHPATGKNCKKTKQINEEIIKIIKQADNASIETHVEALDLFSIVDIAIFDNSSLIIDFLHFEKPILATDMFLPDYHDASSFKMLEACTMLNEKNIRSLNEILSLELQGDPNRNKRQQIRSYYLGDYAPGESTKLFIKKILKAIRERDRIVQQ